MRKSRQDWVDAGLQLIREEGQQALTIERLTQILSLTKGSFYHHFGGLPNYRQALLDCWEYELTVHPMEIAMQESDPQKRRRKLGETVKKLDQRLDLSIRAWGMRDPEVQIHVRRVDDLRIQCLSRLYEGTGMNQPDLLARIQYAAFLGAQQLGLISREFDAHIDQALLLLSNHFSQQTESTSPS
jgi:AcrR family transcriptional regulator